MGEYPDQAIDEIAERLKAILDQHGPRSLASLIGGGSFDFLSGIYPGRLVRLLGSKWVYSSSHQEFSGRFWAHGLTFGNQGILLDIDHENCDMLMLIGKNPMMSHHFQQARKYLKAMSKDPDRLLVVVDPRVTETAKIADILLPIRPGTDALLMRAMIAIILNEGLHHKEYISNQTNGFDEILPWFADFDVKAALKLCQLDYQQVTEVCREFAARRSSIEDDLGTLMNRHSALVSYLIVVQLALCGRVSMPGGNYMISPGRGADPRDPKVWRTLFTDIPAINNHLSQ